MSSKIWLFLGAILAGASVLLGAYGSHGLELRLKLEQKQGPTADTNPDLPVARMVKDYDTAVRYQMIHAFALLLVGVMAALAPSRWWAVAGVCFLLGEVLFCGGLYAIVFTWDPKWGAGAPIGGVAFASGWVLFAAGSLLARLPRPQADSLAIARK